MAEKQFLIIILIILSAIAGKNIVDGSIGIKAAASVTIESSPTFYWVLISIKIIVILAIVVRLIIKINK